MLKNLLIVRFSEPIDAHGDVLNSPLSEASNADILAAAETVRATLKGARSDRLLRLFDYLLAKSVAGETPSEQQIANEAFLIQSTHETSRDTNVRVYVHRLRKVLESASAEGGTLSFRIPVGEYRICVASPPVEDVAAPTDIATNRPLNWKLERPSASMLLRFALVLAIALPVTGLAWMVFGRSPPPLTKTLAWEALSESARPLIVVAGDYYLYAKLDDTMAVDVAPRLVWDKGVPTREDLTIVQILDPLQAHTFVDYNQQFVTRGTIEALSILRNTLQTNPSLHSKSATLVSASQLTPEMLKSSDIIYVGQFSGMPALLRDPLSQASRFRIEAGFDGLADSANANRYNSDHMVLTDERIARRDFAYLASIPGPANNHLLVIAGIGDAGVKEAMQLVSSVLPMQQLPNDGTRQVQGFEALYRVRTIKDINVGATKVLEQPLKSKGIWDTTGHVEPYRPIDSDALPSPKK